MRSIHKAASAAAQLARRGRKGPPSEEDAPRRGARGPRPLDGQLDLYGVEHRRRPQRKLEEAEPDE